MHKVKLSNRSISVCYMAIALLPILFNSCKKDPVNGKNSLVEFIQEAPGEECTNGGIQIIEGLDANGNNVLDEDEIESVEFICNGTNGLNGEDGQDGVDGVNSIVEVVDEPAGENCAEGGSKILAGYDTNKNNLLDLEEILTTEFICNGEDGGFDKKMEIFFPINRSDSKDTTFSLFDSTSFIYDFSLNDYPGVDSIVFSANLACRFSNTTGSFMLFDATNNEPIANSVITISSKTPTRRISSNTISSMPDGRFNLAIIGKTSSQNKLVDIKVPSLILYRSSKNE